jgi:hypothetical protein
MTESDDKNSTGKISNYHTGSCSTCPITIDPKCTSAVCEGHVCVNKENTATNFDFFTPKTEKDFIKPFNKVYSEKFYKKRKKSKQMAKKSKRINRK